VFLGLAAELEAAAADCSWMLARQQQQQQARYNLRQAYSPLRPCRRDAADQIRQQRRGQDRPATYLVVSL